MGKRRIWRIVWRFSDIGDVSRKGKHEMNDKNSDSSFSGFKVSRPTTRHHHHHCALGRNDPRPTLSRTFLSIENQDGLGAKSLHPANKDASIFAYDASTILANSPTTTAQSKIACRSKSAQFSPRFEPGFLQ